MTMPVIHAMTMPTEQAFVAGEVADGERPRLYAVYNWAGAIAGALGSLAAAAPDAVARATGWSTETSQRLGFVVYAGIAVAVAVLYRRLPREPHRERVADRNPLGRSRRTVWARRLSRYISMRPSSSLYTARCRNAARSKCPPSS